MKFIQAANYTPVVSRTIDLLVIHDMEFPETISAAEDVAMYFHNQPKSSATGSSAHYCLDSDSVVQCVRDHDVAWAAPGANSDGLHFEFAGYAKQTGKEWRDDYDLDMLWIGAYMFARRAHYYHIPLQLVDEDGLRKGRSGITTHRLITDSGIGGPTASHQDPGPNFPLHHFLSMIAEASKDLFG